MTLTLYGSAAPLVFFPKFALLCVQGLQKSTVKMVFIRIKYLFQKSTMLTASVHSKPLSRD